MKFLPLPTAETSARVSPEARAVFASVLWEDSLTLRAAPTNKRWTTSASTLCRRLNAFSEFDNDP